MIHLIIDLDLMFWFGIFFCLICYFVCKSPVTSKKTHSLSHNQNTAPTWILNMLSLRTGISIEIWPLSFLFSRWIIFCKLFLGNTTWKINWNVFMFGLCLCLNVLKATVVKTLDGLICDLHSRNLHLPCLKLRAKALKNRLCPKERTYLLTCK